MILAPIRIDTNENCILLKILKNCEKTQVRSLGPI